MIFRAGRAHAKDSSRSAHELPLRAHGELPGVAEIQRGNQAERTHVQVHGGGSRLTPPPLHTLFREVCSKPMGRAVTIILIFLALTNIAYGDLLRPCQCDVEGGAACGFCPSSSTSPDEPAAPC